MKACIVVLLACVVASQALSSPLSFAGLKALVSQGDTTLTCIAEKGKAIIESLCSNLDAADCLASTQSSIASIASDCGLAASASTKVKRDLAEETVCLISDYYDILLGNWSSLENCL